MEEEKLKLYDYKKIIPSELNFNFSLTDLEQKIFSFFLGHNYKNSIFRVAGGWVRDKLLSIHNEDIDITIDNITGQEYLSLLQSQTKDINSAQFKIIKNTNSKSSKLETATINLYGKDIDIVNLRKEIYEENSRIPKISAGTAEEDAFRRDITINCLFYNINKKIVEDFTNKGIDDLKKGIINTPKDAKISFNEDPLRVLRVIRFGTRFGFNFDKNILDNLYISDEFKNIISFQRIEKEFSKMMENDRFYSSIYILYKFNYLEYFLNFSELDINFVNKNENIDDKLFINSAVNLILIKSYLDRNNYLKISKEKESLILTKEIYKLNNYSCLLLPYKNIQVYESKNKSCPLSKIILSKKFFLQKSEINDIMINIEGTSEFLNIIKSEINRYNISLFLMKYKFKNIFNIIKLCACEEYLKCINSNGIIEDINNDIMKICNKFNDVISFIEKENLEKIENMKPIVDGKEIKKIFNIKDGKEIKKYIDLVIKEQINNPNITKEKCIEIIKNQNK